MQLEPEGTAEFDGWNFLDSAAIEAADADPEWLISDLLIDGDICVLFAATGAGKSLFVLEQACEVARSGTHVLYMDAENSHRDLAGRLADLGYTDTADLNKLFEFLHYASFPDIQVMNKALGGRQVEAMTRQLKAGLVVVDTLARFVDGEENSNDTANDFARESLRRLKSLRVSAIVLDHPGKDASRGPRGGYAKTTYVDVVWEMKADGDWLVFKSHKNRSGKYRDTVTFQRSGGLGRGGLTHRQVELADGLKVARRVGKASEQVQELIAWLDENKVPHGLGRRAVKQLEGCPSCANGVLDKAISARRQRDGTG